MKSLDINRELSGQVAEALARKASARSYSLVRSQANEAS